MQNISENNRNSLHDHVHPCREYGWSKFVLYSYVLGQKRNGPSKATSCKFYAYRLLSPPLVWTLIPATGRLTLCQGRVASSSLLETSSRRLACRVQSCNAEPQMSNMSIRGTSSEFHWWRGWRKGMWKYHYNSFMIEKWIKGRRSIRQCFTWIWSPSAMKWLNVWRKACPTRICWSSW